MFCVKVISLTKSEKNKLSFDITQVKFGYSWCFFHGDGPDWLSFTPNAEVQLKAK